MSQLFEVEERPDSPQPAVSFFDSQHLSPDSPVPQYIYTEPPMLTAMCRSTSPYSVYSDEDLETDLCIPWLFEDRAESPGSTATKDELRSLSPDSPIPEFAPGLKESAIYHIESRSSSPASVSSDLERERDLCFSMLFEERPSSPESVASVSEHIRLSPDSPIPEFIPALSVPYVDVSRCRSSSPESVTSSVELSPLMSQLFEVEERPDSPQPAVSFFDSQHLSPDSPVPQYIYTEPPMLTAICRSTSPYSVYSDEDLETDLCIPWLFEDRAESPGSTATKDELRSLSPDSPIPEFAPGLHESTISHIDSRSSSPASVSSDLERERDLCFSMLFEERPSSPESVASVSEHIRLSPDSPIPEFILALSVPYVDVSRCRSSSPESVTSSVELSPLMSQLFEVEERPDSPQPAVSFFHFQHLSPDSPVPQYIYTEPPMLTAMCRSTSPYSVYSDEDLETDLCIPWLFEDRAESPGSTATKDELRSLSPDSPIPEFTPALHETTISDMDMRSITTDSELLDLEMELPLPTSLESRPLSPESQASMRLSPDSPVPDFMQLKFAVPEAIFGHRSTSPESLCSDMEYVVISMGSLVFESRPSSPDSGASVDKYQALTPDSPIIEYRPALPENVIINSGYRSSSPESIESDIEYAVSECFMSMNYGVWERPDSPKSVGAEVPLDMECELLPSSERSFNEFRFLPPELSIPASDGLDLICTKEASQYIASDKEELLMTPTCSVTEFKVPTATEATIDSTVVSTTIAPTSTEESAMTVARYNLVYDDELWKLISQVHDPQYSGETFSSKTGFMQFIGNTRGVSDNLAQDKNEQEANATAASSEVTYTTTDTATAAEDFDCASAQVITDTSVESPPPPMLEHVLPLGTSPYRGTRYRFETHAPEVVSMSQSHELCHSPESSIDFRSMSPNPVMAVEARALSPESVILVNNSKPLSPDSPLPTFGITLPECVSFLRSESSLPETIASEIDFMPLDLENERDRPLSSQSLPEYRPMLVELAMQMTDIRASSPESMSEFSENRPLSPDSPIPQFPLSLEEYTITLRSSSTESVRSDSECELTVISSRGTETERPSSPESISSLNDFKLLPDSPVPEFMRILSSYFMDATPIDQSPSPVSLSSDSEYVALPIDCWIDDSPRPVSPETAESEEELGFCCEGRVDRLASEQEPLSHVTSSLLPEQPSSVPNKMPLLVYQTIETNSKEGCTNLDLESNILSYTTWMQPASEAGSMSSLQTTVSEEDIPSKSSPVQDVKRKEEKTLYISTGELKSKTASQMAPATVTQDDSKVDVLFTDEKPKKSVPLQLPDQNSHTTHRTVTPVLHSLEKTVCLKEDRSHGYSDWKLSPKEAHSTELFSPMSSQFLVPPDYEAVFSGQQTLRVSECSQASLNDFSPVSPVFSDSIPTQVVTESNIEGEDFEFSPDFNRVLSEFEKTVSEFESEEPKVPPKEGSQSPQHSDSDMEFFDCRQAFSDFSEPEEVKLEHDITYHISEPPSPMPGSTPDISFSKQSPQYTAHNFLQVDDFKRHSSGSESLGEFAYDSEGSRECRTEGDLPFCEELPSRDQAGFYDDDDFLGRVRGRACTGWCLT
ncbi:uncharacterized protein LOC113157297 [Anabas testudineus]|uniref:uncharacterized protein LOC113157297 n=1 Tax=Anabas testudineus TaxID=64144 RepID=UPI000E45A7C1|nr:uncharacterized protein LOC113157297 [Anabas testudineus]